MVIPIMTFAMVTLLLFFIKNIYITEYTQRRHPTYLEDIISRPDICNIHPLAVNVMTICIPAAHRDSLIPIVVTWKAFLKSLKTLKIWYHTQCITCVSGRHVYADSAFTFGTECIFQTKTGFVSLCHSGSIKCEKVIVCEHFNAVVVSANEQINLSLQMTTQCLFPKAH